MPCMEAVESFVQAQRECGRMWHAMRYARLNLIELKARRWVSGKDLAEARALFQSTRKLYFQALERLFVRHAEMAKR